MKNKSSESKTGGLDPEEIQDWLESLADIQLRYGPQGAASLLALLQQRAYQQGVPLSFTANTPYVNTISAEQQPVFPGDRELERRIKNAVRWNAMAMVVRANRDKASPGGHISTFASAATLYEVGYNHFFRAPDREKNFSGDLVYFQGHAAPGIYARAYLEGRLDEQHLMNFRRELQSSPGLSSYPHPWLMPDFWQFPTVSMGLGPLNSIYQARFQRYMENRGLKKKDDARVWCFVGDGETDEPETLGAISLAVREKLNNLTWVINCNLQRLDGPVRGNGKIIQELERIFRGAGWNVIKVVWGSQWDALLEDDNEGLLAARMDQVVDGQYQKYTVSDGDYIRKHFFNTPALRELVKHLSDNDIQKIGRGGHDVEKVYAAYHRAVETVDRPTVILAKTIKGYGLGEAGEGRNVSHQQKKMDEESLREFRNRFSIPISDEDLDSVPFYRPGPDSAEMKYLRSRREALGGALPVRLGMAGTVQTPKLDAFAKFIHGTGERSFSTTTAFAVILAMLLKDKQIGQLIVPIIPDEARTFGMDPLFTQIGIYASQGQQYEPVDAQNMSYYREAKDGQLLEEGIAEAGAMASFVAAGTAYSTCGVNTIPFYIYYSMFGFQRVGDQIWLAADSRAKGFLLGGTAGRTTLNGEGLQHQDGHSLLAAAVVPNLLSYDCAFQYEIAVVIEDGLRRMYGENEQVFYYLTLQNENYQHPAMPEGVEEGIRRGMYLFEKVNPKSEAKIMVRLLGSGAILNEVRRAAQILAENYGVASEVYSVTSYQQLRRDALIAERENRLGGGGGKSCHLWELCGQWQEPVIAASDYVRMVPEQIRPWLNSLTVLGTDGFGRSDGREELRRFFEVDAEHVVYTALFKLEEYKKLPPNTAKDAVAALKITLQKKNPLTD